MPLDPAFGPGFWIRLIRPSLAGWITLGLTALVAVVGAMFSAWIIAEDGVDPGALLFLLCLLILTPTAIGCWLTGVVAGGSLARALQFSIASALFGVEFVVLAVAMLLDGDPWSAVVLSVGFFGPFLLISVPPAVGFWIGSRPEIRSARRAAREAWAGANLVDHAGPLSAIADALDLDERQTADLLLDLTEEHVLDGRIDADWWFAESTLDGLRDQLLAEVEGEGGVRLEDLAGALKAPGAPEPGVPEEAVRRWLYELVFRGRFTGYVNWTEKRIYAAAAEQLRERSVCPSCGDRLTLGRGGTVRCGSCGTDVMVAA